MKGKKFLIILICLFLMSPSIGLAEVIFEDDFNSENNSQFAYRYFSFANWNVTDGSVDLVNSDLTEFSSFKSNGMFVDLEGTSYDPGILKTKTSFTFLPGYTYELLFDLAGSQRPQYTEYDTVTVSLGSIYSEDFTLHGTEPFQTFTYRFTVNATTTANLSFENWVSPSGGGDDVGLLLDNVAIYSYQTPKPSIDSILDLFNESVSNGTLTGVGQNAWLANLRLFLMREMLEAAKELIENEKTGWACFTLNRALLRCDGEDRPLDFVEGDAVLELNTLISDLMADLGCI